MMKRKYAKRLILDAALARAGAIRQDGLNVAGLEPIVGRLFDLK